MNPEQQVELSTFSPPEENIGLFSGQAYNPSDWLPWESSERRGQDLCGHLSKAAEGKRVGRILGKESLGSNVAEAEPGQW